MLTLSSIRRVALGRLALLLIVTGLLTLVLAPSVIGAADCASEPVVNAQSFAAAERGRFEPDADVVDELDRTSGLDLEVRVMNLRIQFPWMKALPITPAHHVVITLLPGRDPAR